MSRDERSFRPPPARWNRSVTPSMPQDLDSLAKERRAGVVIETIPCGKGPMTANGMLPGQEPPTHCAICGRPYQVRGAQICPECMDAVIDSDPGEEGESEYDQS